MRMRRFWIALYAVTALTHVPFAIGVAWALGRAGVPRAPLLAAALAIALVALLRGRVRRARADRPVPAWRLALVEEPYYAHWGACIGALFAFVPALLVTGALALVGAAPPVGAVALFAYGLGLALALWGVFVRRHIVQVRTIDVPIAGLGEGLDGYRIAQLSDLHIGSLWPGRRAARWIEHVDRLAPDLVALTGDYVTSGTAFHGEIADTLGALRAKDGAIAVMGNHDYFGDGEPLVTLLRERGVRVLRNEHTVLEKDGARLVVAGVDDTWTRRADVDRAVSGRDEGLPLLALAHDPQLFPFLAERGAQLVLSGHTHWGQVAVPFASARFNLSRLSYRYHAGVYREGDATLYVHPGLGTTGPPIRLGAAPEITVFVLRRA
ncbi:MAG TPA: metallophosphoesterase [Minicystis sp.]|nr:metallophosphoesterase [Minicystis sp.]